MKNNDKKQMNQFARQAAMVLQVGVLCEAIDAGKFAPYLTYSLDDGGLVFTFDDEGVLRIEDGIDFRAGNFTPELIQNVPEILDDDDDFFCVLNLEFENENVVNLIKAYGINGGEIVDEEPRENLWHVLQEDDPDFYGKTYPPLNMPNIIFENPTTRKVEEFIEFFNGVFTETALRRIFQTYENWLSDPVPATVSSDELRNQWTEAHPKQIWRDFDGCDNDSIWKTDDRTIYDLAALNKITIAIDTGGCDVAGMTETRVLVMR